MVDWDYLITLLTARGFRPRWLGWIQNILVSSKSSALINGSPNGYIKYQRGLRQEYSLLMFNHTLNYRLLVGVSLWEHGNICHLLYANDLTAVLVGEHEDLKIIKLILYLFKVMSGLSINFHIACLYTTNWDMPPDPSSLRILNCAHGLLLITYLGILISGR